MDYLKINQQNIINYNDFKNKMNKLLDKLKQKEKYIYIIKSFNYIENKNIYLILLLFQNYEQWINIHLENNNIDTNNIMYNFVKKEEKIDKDDNKINNIFCLLIEWTYFLYIQLIKNLYSNEFPNYSEVNKIKYLLKETNYIIIKLYKSNIINSTHIFEILNFYLFLIESNYDITTHTDILYKYKNYLLFKGIFFILQEASNIIIKKVNLNSLDDEETTKTDIDKIFKFLEEFQNNKEVNYRLNIIILINQNLITNFISNFLKKINFTILNKYEEKKSEKELSYKNKLINFYSHFIKFNYKKSKIFNQFIGTLKDSFIDLYDFDNNKEKIINDLYVQGFYTKLIKFIFFFDESAVLKKNIIPNFNSFFFNGFNSEISLNLQNNKFLEKSSLFFSFNISPKDKFEIYPLFIIEKDFDKKNKKELLFNIYLKKDKSSNKNDIEEFDLYIFKDDNEKKIENLPKIISNTTYYFNITFIVNKFYISFYNGKGEIIQFEQDKNKKLFDSGDYNLIFGYNKKENKSFSGYIGPIIIIKNPTNSKEVKNNDLISLFLKLLQNNYPNFIFLDPNSSYSLDYINHFHNKHSNNNIIKQFEKINGFECYLYLTPDIIDHFNEIPDQKNTLPDIGDICPNQKNYKINNINVTLIKHEQGIINFIMDNGLNYICLLYEYIYQFMENYYENENNSFISNKDLLNKLILSIFKKTLFILKIIYSEINVHNFNKSLKQIHMNLFSCIRIISKDYYIMEHIVNDFYNIIINYCSYIVTLSNNQKKTNSKEEYNSNNEDKINNDLLKINLSFLNGWIDFLLTPNLYDFKNTDTLIVLFDKISSYFNEHVESSINQHFYSKLLYFAPYLSSYFEEEYEQKNDEKNIIFENNNIDENDNSNFTKEKEVLSYYLKCLKSFFERNPSKSENIINLKTILKYINEELGNNYHACLGYYNFINELIGNNPDLYFNDEKDEDQIKQLIIYANKYSKHYILGNTDSKDENLIKNKKIIFNRLISIIMRIIFTKKRLNKKTSLVNEFKKLIQKVDITNELISSITDEIKNIIDFTIGANKNTINSGSKKTSFDKNEKKGKYYSSDELKYISNFYSQIFDLILFFFEYPNNHKNIKSEDYENIIFDLLLIIRMQIKGNIDNIITNNDSKNQNNISNDDNNVTFTIDTIYCLIYFIKFYNTILFKRFYPLKYVREFVEICELCEKSCLINSNILIELDNCSKTILEIILDICLYYFTKSSKHVIKENTENFIAEQEEIYNYLKKLFPNINSKSKDLRQKYTVFYNSDYLRLMSDNYLNENKKIKKDKQYGEYEREFSNYKIIANLLLNEDKFNLNFSTFFSIKLNGYNKILIELNVEINTTYPQNKTVLKLNNDLLKLIVETLHLVYSEHETLYSLNKDFFFKSKKANSTSFFHYLEVKKRIEHCLKKKDYSSIDQYIINQIFPSDYDKVYTLIYSGLCKKDSENFSLNIFHGHKRSADISDFNTKKDKKRGDFYGRDRYAYSSTNLLNALIENHQNNQEDEQQNTPKTVFKHKTKTMKEISLDSGFGNNNINKNLVNQDYDEDEEEFDLCYEDNETPSSGSNIKSIKTFDSDKKINTFNIKSNFISPPPTPINFQRSKGRQKTVIGPKLLLEDIEIVEKKKYTRKERSPSFFTTSSKGSTIINKEAINNIPYINFFDEPDEYYLKNPKKELMMNIFSIYFFESFFYNDKFKLLKNYYLQNFDGIQASTKKLDFPSKIKNFSNGLEPFLFLKPFSEFFTTKIFPISHKYFYEYMKKNKIFPEPIILYQKIIPEFNLENQFEKNCELIKEDHNYYGNMIGSCNYNFIVFEEQEYEFYNDMNNIISQRQINDGDLDNLFTLSLISKKPPNKHMEKILKNIEKNELSKNRKYKEKKRVIILFNEIEEILERRFLLMWQGIEIYLKNGKSYFFNFLTKENNQFILDLFRNNTILKDKIHEKDYFKSQKIMNEWMEERLSTYEYLLFINKYSSRTFNDSNQYPIFPWLIKNYPPNTSTDEDFRNFKFPMAAQTEENQNRASTRFEDDIDNNSKFPAHFGTHYSTSAYVYYYLMREEPFTTLLIQLQGYKQENPDRMFFSLEELLGVLDTGHDNREMIPDLFYKIEVFINLNCVNFGRKNIKTRVDDFISSEAKNNKKRNNNKKEINKYVGFIIENRKLLDGKRISKNLNDWIDNVFGIGQLPPDKNRKKSLNIFYKETYEQKTDLHKKLKNFQKKNKNDMKVENIIKKISNKIDLIISFGQTPYQLFNDKHPKYGKRLVNAGEGDFEYDLYMEAWNKNMKYQIDFSPLFFIINFDFGKLFLIDEERKLEIVDSTLFMQKGNDKYQFNKYGHLQLPYIKFTDNIYININDKEKSPYYIIKQKYCISSFHENNFNTNQSYIPRESENKLNKLFSTKDLDKFAFNNTLNNNINESENNNNIKYDCNDNEYISYYNLYVNKIKYETPKFESRKSKRIKIEEEYFRFITCRHIDNTFKIYTLPKNNSKLKKDYIPISFVCEDFVTSCCAISYNKFLIGLKDGKLIQWSIEEKNDDCIKKQNIKSKINIKFNKQIQAHKKSINVIEINHRLGIIITAGSDNYVFIRKIYDLELLIPIKIKPKYIITMAKVSPMNFLYLMCFNKNNKKSCIFGYTLNGIYFAKSNYDYFDSLDFTKSGNIVTWIHKKEIQILYGDNLKKINFSSKDEANLFNHNQKKLIGSTWVTFNYLLKKNEQDSNVKIITYALKEKSKELILTLDVSKLKCFD